MTPKLVDARYLDDYRIRLRFGDGTSGVIDLEEQLWGEVFEPLRDPDVFQGFRLDPDLHTIVWPSGADFAPEFLYEQVHGHS